MSWARWVTAVFFARILDFFGRVAAFCDSCAYGLNNTATPLPDTFIRAIFQVVKCEQSPPFTRLTQRRIHLRCAALLLSC